ncbi:RNA chaperone Hfq [bacterium]|nr:RNA chaperone Hfq [bacterium]
MSEYNSKIQNQFLSGIRKRHLPVEVLLDTGASLHGKVKGYDQFSITLVFKDKIEVVYKSAILMITTLPRKVRPRPFGGYAQQREFQGDSEFENHPVERTPRRRD